MSIEINDWIESLLVSASSLTEVEIILATEPRLDFSERHKVLEMLPIEFKGANLFVFFVVSESLSIVGCDSNCNCEAIFWEKHVGRLIVQQVIVVVYGVLYVLSHDNHSVR